MTNNTMFTAHEFVEIRSDVIVDNYGYVKVPKKYRNHPVVVIIYPKKQ